MPQFYICNNCGNFISEGSLDFTREILDVIDGVPYTEPRSCCPFCDSFDIFETELD